MAGAEKVAGPALAAAGASPWSAALDIGAGFMNGFMADGGGPATQPDQLQNESDFKTGGHTIGGVTFGKKNDFVTLAAIGGLALVAFITVLK